MNMIYRVEFENGKRQGVYYFNVPLTPATGSRIEAFVAKLYEARQRFTEYLPEVVEETRIVSITCANRENVRAEALKIAEGE